MRRRTRNLLIIAVATLAIITIAIFIYFNFFNKHTYHIVKLSDATEFTASDFVDKSELEFYENQTFHIHIEHKDNGISLTAIGTYKLDGDTYQLEFVQIFARNIHNEIVNLLGDNEDAVAMRKKISCVRKDKQIVFTDHKNQTYYFA